MPRRAAKTDKNHSEIVNGLKATFGPDCVFDLSAVGHGCPDIMVGVRGKTILLEIKTNTGKPTPSQIRFFQSWRGQAAFVRSLDEALTVIERVTL